MKAVYKYLLPPFESEFEMQLPMGAKLLSVQSQHGRVHLWALVDQNAPLARFTFRLVTTGRVIENNDPLHGMDFLGTFQLRGGNHIGHVWGKEG